MTEFFEQLLSHKPYFRFEVKDLLRAKLKKNVSGATAIYRSLEQIFQNSSAPVGQPCHIFFIHDQNENRIYDCIKSVFNIFTD